MITKFKQSFDVMTNIWKQFIPVYVGATSVTFVEVLEFLNQISPVIINSCQIVILILTIIYLKRKLNKLKNHKY